MCALCCLGSLARILPGRSMQRVRYRALCPAVSQASSIRRTIRRTVSHSIPSLRCSQACVRIFSPMRALAHRHQSGCGSLHEALCPPSQPQFAPQPPCESPAPSRAALCDAMLAGIVPPPGRGPDTRLEGRHASAPNTHSRHTTDNTDSRGGHWGLDAYRTAACSDARLGMQTSVAHSIFWVRLLALFMRLMHVRARDCELRRVGVHGACMDREQNRTRGDGLLYLCHVPLLACIYMVYIWAAAIQYVSFVRAVMSVYIILKCKIWYMLVCLSVVGNAKRSPRVTFFRYCADVTYPPHH